MSPLSLKLMQFCRKSQLDIGSPLPDGSFNKVFNLDANPKERKELPCAIHELIRAGYLTKVEKNWSGIGSPYRLTEAGYEFIYAENFISSTPISSPTMTTQNFHFNGTAHNIQIGDNNTQQIFAAVEMLANAIEKAEVSSEEKAEAKGALAAMLNNRVISTLLAGVGIEAFKSLLG